MPAKPTDKKLYDSVKKKVYKDNPVHSAYRSGALVKAYKAEFKRKHGAKKEPYTGGKKNAGLTRWFKEEWTTQAGKKEYKKPGDIFRPSKRVSKRTPATHQELSKKEIEAARKEKAATGRVQRFRFPKGMQEKIIKFTRGPKGKKYTAHIQSDTRLRKVHFGSADHEHFKDSTPLKLWAKKNHGDSKRRRAYFSRHSAGITGKLKALAHEIKKSKGKYNARILSHQYLW